MQAPLGEFEVVVLMAVLRVGNDVNGSEVRKEIERRTGRRVSRGAVYVTLDRLEHKRLVASRTLTDSTVRGGITRLFRVTPAGLKDLRHAVATFARMHEGLEPVLGDL
jgi:PadR family transcriptional regulator, regulatory protein PadR